MWDSLLSKNRRTGPNFHPGPPNTAKKEEPEKDKLSDNKDVRPSELEVKRYSSAGAGMRDFSHQNSFSDVPTKFGPRGSHELVRKTSAVASHSESKNGCNYSHHFQNSFGSHPQLGSHSPVQQDQTSKSSQWFKSKFHSVGNSRSNRVAVDDFRNEHRESSPDSKCPDLYYSRSHALPQNNKNGTLSGGQRKNNTFSSRDNSDSSIAHNLSGFGMNSVSNRKYIHNINLPTRPDTSGEASRSNRVLESLKGNDNYSIVKPRFSNAQMDETKLSRIISPKNSSIPLHRQNLTMKKSPLSESSLSAGRWESNQFLHFISDSGLTSFSASLPDHASHNESPTGGKSLDYKITPRKLSDSSRFVFEDRGVPKRPNSGCPTYGSTDKESTDASSDKGDKKLYSTGGVDGNKVSRPGSTSWNGELQDYSFVSSRQLLSTFMFHWRSQNEESKSAYVDGGYMKVGKGNQIDNRFVIIQKLGWGEFSTVWLAYDTRYFAYKRSPREAFVALKIAKCQQLVIETTMYEINLLRYLCAKLKACPKTELLDSFSIPGEYGTHLCMVMPVHGANLLSIIDHMNAAVRKRTVGEIRMVKEIIASTLVGLHELSTINVIHTDIKPENIIATSPDPKVVELMLEFSKYNSRKQKRRVVGVEELLDSIQKGDPKHLVCLADFGLSTALDTVESVEKCSDPEIRKLMSRVVARKKHFPVKTPGTMQNIHGTLIQTREYRSPEVILGMDFNCQTDVWSVGCTAFELITGFFLMDPKKKAKNERHMDAEHLFLMSQLIGGIPPEILALRSRFHEFYENRSKGMHVHPPEGCPLYLDSFVDAKGRFVYAEQCKKYQRRRLDTELEVYLDSNEAKLAADFILACLHSFDPRQRPTALEVLRHPWLNDVFEKKDQDVVG